MQKINRRPSPAMVVAIIALVVALGGTATGASRFLSGSKIKKGSLPGNRIKKNSVTGTQVNESKLGVVPSALDATHAATADSATHAATADGAPPTGTAGGALVGSYPNPSLAGAEGWHEVGAPGEPAFRSSCTNSAAGIRSETVAFYKDQLGVVHLRGGYTCALGAHGNPAFALPAGYRPADGKVLAMSVACDCTAGTQAADTGRADILGVGAGGSGGEVILRTAQSSPAGDVHLDGITFRAAG